MITILINNQTKSYQSLMYKNNMPNNMKIYGKQRVERIKKMKDHE